MGWKTNTAIAAAAITLISGLAYRGCSKDGWEPFTSTEAQYKHRVGEGELKITIEDPQSTRRGIFYGQYLSNGGRTERPYTQGQLDEHMMLSDSLDGEQGQIDRLQSEANARGLGEVANDVALENMVRRWEQVERARRQDLDGNGQLGSVNRAWARARLAGEAPKQPKPRQRRHRRGHRNY